MKLRLKAILSILTVSLFMQNVLAEDSSGSVDEGVQVNPMKTLEKLVGDGQYGKAYEQAQDMLFDYEGDPEFDLLYGTAANETGHSDEAVFVFERLVEADPGNVNVQIGLAKAYYKVGNREQAKPIFERVLVENGELSEQEKIQIASYLKAMSSDSAFDKDMKGVFKGLVGVSMGYDDNINTASSADSIEFYNQVLGWWAFIPGIDEEASGYVSPKLSLSFLKPLSEKTAIEIKGNASARKVKSSLEAYDSSTTFIEIGNPWRLEKGTARYAVRQTALSLDGQTLFKLSQFDVAWKQNIDWHCADKLTLAFSAGAMRYDDEAQSYKDINLYALKMALSKQAEQFVHNMAFTLGADRTEGMVTYYDNLVTFLNITEEADEYSRDYVGLAYGIVYISNAKTSYFGNLSVESSSYKDVDHLHQANGKWEKRDGQQVELTVGSRYNWNKELKLHALASAKDAASDVDFYDYAKNTVELGAVYQF